MHVGDRFIALGEITPDLAVAAEKLDELHPDPIEGVLDLVDFHRKLGMALDHVFGPASFRHPAAAHAFMSLLGRFVGSAALGMPGDTNQHLEDMIDEIAVAARQIFDDKTKEMKL